jgi:putative ATPase
VLNREPLASRMRPQTMDEIAGQRHLLGPGRMLRRMIETDQVRSIILFGPPGSGKTSLVNVIAKSTERPFRSLNAVTSGVKEIREAIDQARWVGLVLHIDEVHRLSKNQAEVLLPFVEDGTVTFIGTTSENPYLELPPALRSRSTIFELHPLAPSDVLTVLKRALADPVRGIADLNPDVPDEALEALAGAVGGDLRAALTALELAVTTAPVEGGRRVVTTEWLMEGLRRELHTFSEGDAYDLLSALQKSIRGSDVDAAVLYLARLVAVRFDLETICRRLVVIAAEDVGNASPQAISVTVACVQAAQMIGWPEARIPLAQAVTFLAASPKSNAAYMALDRALADVKEGKGQSVPRHLRDAHYSGAARLGRGVEYRYPHDYPGNWVRQQYLPDDLLGRRYYEPTENGSEKAIREKLNRLRDERT